MIRRFWPFTRRTAAPPAEVKPAPTPLQEVQQRIEESVRQTRERTERLLERLRERERRAS